MKKKKFDEVNELRIGDIGFHANLPMPELIGFAKGILKDKVLKEYLEFKKNQRLSGASYFG